MIIHIGTQKTGSKAIQHFLASRTEPGAETTFCFPEAGRDGVWHEPLYQDVVRGDTSRLEMAVREVAHSGASIGVLSCEAFYRLPKDRIHLVRSAVGDASIILFVRRQDQLINAMYNQLIKAHRVSFTMLREFEQTAHDYHLDFDHMATVDRWGQVFGYNRVIPVVYDKQTSSLELFIHHAGIPRPQACDSDPSTNRNPALDMHGLAILRLVKQMCDHDEHLPRLVETARQLLHDRVIDTYKEGDFFVFSLAERQAIVNLYTDSNEALRARYFPDLPVLFAPPTADLLSPGRGGCGLAEIATAKTTLDAESMGLIERIFRDAGVKSRSFS